MELFCRRTGILPTILLFLAVKIVNIEFGTNMEDSSTQVYLMIMWSQVLNGHQMEKFLQLEHLKCLDFVTKQVGLIVSINQRVAHYLLCHGQMMEQQLLQQVVMDQLRLDT